ncbi:MAG: DMT family transporter [Albidovulum sp.]
MTAQPHRPVLAAIWMLGSIAGFSAIAIAGREIGSRLDTFEMMLYRSLIGLLAVATVAVATGRSAVMAPRHLRLHLFRNLLHFAGQNLWLYALALIPLAQLFALEFSAPVMVALAAPFVLKERLTPSRAVSAVVGFAGVLVVARPSSLGAITPGLAAALLSAVAFAATALATKRLTGLTPVFAILFWLVAMQTGLGLLCAGWDGDITLPDRHTLPWVIVLGFAGLLAHLGLTKALSLAAAAVVTPLDFMRLPLIALVGMALYGEPLDPFVLVGGAVIFAANWINIRAETKFRSVTNLSHDRQTADP